MRTFIGWKSSSWTRPLSARKLILGFLSPALSTGFSTLVTTLLRGNLALSLSLSTLTSLCISSFFLSSHTIFCLFAVSLVFSFSTLLSNGFSSGRFQSLLDRFTVLPPSFSFSSREPLCNFEMGSGGGSTYSCRLEER